MSKYITTICLIVGGIVPIIVDTGSSGEEKGMSELEGISFIKTIIDKSVKNDKK